MTDVSLIHTLMDLSGAVKNVGRKKKLKWYSSINLPGFDVYDSWRDTNVRMDNMHVPKDMSNKTVVDYGSCIGSISFECCNRGASVVGIEYNKQRVDVCNKIAEQNNLDARFICADLDDLTIEFPNSDISFFLSTDRSLNVCLKQFYQKVAKSTNEIVYIESIFNPSEPAFNDYQEMLENIFTRVEYVGNEAAKYWSPVKRLFVCHI